MSIVAFEERNLNLVSVARACMQVKLRFFGFWTAVWLPLFLFSGA